MGAGQAGGRAGGLCALLFLLPPVAIAQVAPNRTTLYLHPTDVSDARALWVNPAGLGRVEEASLHLDVTVGDPGSSGRLRQLTAGFNSRGLSFGYQRDLFRGGVRGRGHTYRLGLAGGRQGLALGLATAFYRGDASGTGWDLGLVYEAAPALTVGGVIGNIGRPTVRDSTLAVTYVAGATWRPFGPQAALSAHGRFTAEGGAGYAFGVRAGLREGTRLPLRLLARLDTDHSLRRAGFAFGLSLGGEDLAGAVATAPGDLGRLDALSLYGVSTRQFRSRGAPGR